MSLLLTSSMLMVLSLTDATPAPVDRREHFHAGRVAFGQGNLDKAIHEFKKATQNHPQPPALPGVMGWRTTLSLPATSPAAF